jgi:hypothetical protein
MKMALIGQVHRTASQPVPWHDEHLRVLLLIASVSSSVGVPVPLQDGHVSQFIWLR